MSYVPIVPRSDRTRISPRARELAAQIDKLVQDFQRSYPDTRPTDVQEARRP
jgi:outer membrane murein-binding lipoprotein Lpp